MLTPKCTIYGTLHVAKSLSTNGKRENDELIQRMDNADYSPKAFANLSVAAFIC